MQHIDLSVRSRNPRILPIDLTVQAFVAVFTPVGIAYAQGAAACYRGIDCGRNPFNRHHTPRQFEAWNNGYASELESFA